MLGSGLELDKLQRGLYERGEVDMHQVKSNRSYHTNTCSLRINQWKNNKKIKSVNEQ